MSGSEYAPPSGSTLRTRFRRWIYRRLCNPFRTLLTQEMLCEMLRSNSKTLTWTVSLDFDGGVRDVLTMTVTCDKVESNTSGEGRRTDE